MSDGDRGAILEPYGYAVQGNLRRHSRKGRVRRANGVYTCSSQMSYAVAHAECTRRRPNDVRIDCKAAKHSDGDRGAVLAPS